MEKSLLDALNEFGYKQPSLVMSTLKALAYNGITSVDILLKMKPDEILKIKGIGPKSMALIAKVMTKEEAIRSDKKAVYDKFCHEISCTCLRDWFEKAGLNRLSACQLEKVMKRNGIKTVDDFMKHPVACYETFKGIGPKRMETIVATRRMIVKQKKNAEWVARS